MVNTTHNQLRPGFYTCLLAFHADRVSNNAYINYILPLLLRKHKAKFLFYFTDIQ
jgi:hypothetical protein